MNIYCSVCATNPSTLVAEQVSLIHSCWITDRTSDKDAIWRSQGWCIYFQSLASLMVVFMYQIPLKRTKSQVKQAPRCQLSSCQGNEREMWRRGQAPMYSKRSAMLFVKKNKLSVVLLYILWSKFSVITLICINSSYYKWNDSHVTIRSYRQSLDIEMDDDLSKYTDFLSLLTHCVMNKCWQRIN